MRQYENIKAIISESTNFVLTTHVNPDGDAIGSVTALGRFLHLLGKQVTIINVSETPRNMKFLEDAIAIEVYDALQHDSIIQLSDCIFCCDFNDLSRVQELGAVIEQAKGKKVLVDHHMFPKEFYEAELHDVDATSTAELVFDLIMHVDSSKLDALIAQSCYTGILTDTGNFRFPRTSGSTHRMVAQLIDAGANPVVVNENVYNTSTVQKFHLLAYSLQSMDLHANGTLCFMKTSQKVIDEFGCDLEDTEGFVHYTLSILGVQCGVLITELPDVTKLSFRSKGNFPAREMAEHFGGGGHFNAAGARVYNLSLGEIIEQIKHKYDMLISV